MRPKIDSARRAFTLVELLVVVGIIAVLIAILLPALNRARGNAAAVKCLSNLRQIGVAMVSYTTQNHNYVIPSYSMTGVTGGLDVPMEGWACILDRDRYMTGNRENDASVFTCPSMFDANGVSGGNLNQMGTGWMEWPNLRISSTVNRPPQSGEPASDLMMSRGFTKIIRVGYWINADNPIGSATSVTPDTYYTASVGYGPSTNGLYISYTKANRIKKPAQLIVLADGVYAGRQNVTRYGMTNSRIGYRHPNLTVNVSYADGHAETLHSDQMPRGGVREDNVGSGPTLYADPLRSLP